MIRAFTASAETGLSAAPDWRQSFLTDQLVWLDLVAPTHDEKQAVRHRFGLSLPDGEELQHLETTSRLVSTKYGLVVSFRTLPPDREATHSRGVMCILSDERLITVREDLAIGFDPSDSRLVRPDSRTVTAHDVFYGLLDAEFDRISEQLEDLGHQIDTLTSDIFFADERARRSNRVLRDVIHTLGRLGSYTAKVQDSLISFERLGLFLSHHPERAASVPEHREIMRNMISEVRTLGEYARGLDGKVDFLLNASLGFVGVDQNQVMKTITIVAALFLPGTLVSSIFGMNFEDMPAIAWHYGFFAAVGGSVLTALILAMIFRWLRWM